VAAGCSGGDWERVEDGWNLPRYNTMIEHWKRHGPPVYMSVAGYLGLIKEETKGKPKGGNLDELARMFASTGGKI